ncbi:MAG: sigma factor-like helix-turn-helix DNA-binding protein, partial [Gaiellaceae bacterium]
RPHEIEWQDHIADTLVTDDHGPSGEDLRRALSHLAFNQRAALVMRELEGRSYAEIAEVLELSVGAVETLVFRARRALREQLEGALTCGGAEIAISKQLDGRLSRADKGALRAHLRECPECATFARRQRGQRSALKALGAVPLPASLGSLFGGAGSGVGIAVAAKTAVVLSAAALAGGVSYESIHHLTQRARPRPGSAAVTHPAPTRPGAAAVPPASLAAPAAAAVAPFHPALRPAGRAAVQRTRPKAAQRHAAKHHGSRGNASKDQKAQSLSGKRPHYGRHGAQGERSNGRSHAATPKHIAPRVVGSENQGFLRRRGRGNGGRGLGNLPRPVPREHVPPGRSGVRAEGQQVVPHKHSSGGASLRGDVHSPPLRGRAARGPRSRSLGR